MEQNTALASPEGIVYKLPEDFLAEFNEKFLRTVPAEKAAQEIEEAKVAKMLVAEGGHKVDGLGQKMGAIPIREYMRWQQAEPGCWQNDEFVNEFFRDNRHLMAPGYRLKTTRKGGRWNT